MKAMLLNLPFCEQEYVKFSEKWAYIEDEYLGSSIIEAILERCSCEIIIPPQTDLASLMECVAKKRPEVILISAMQSSAVAALDFLKALEKEPHKGVTMLGGWLAKISWKEICRQGWPVDYICYTDAEDVLEKWLLNPEERIDGIVRAQDWQEVQELSLPVNPWADSGLLPVRRAGRKTYRLETSRGCPHGRCLFCSQAGLPPALRHWRSRDANAIIREINLIYNRYGVRRFSLTDDDMLGPISGAEKRARELGRAFAGLPFKISYSASISVRAATNDRILAILQDSGLEQLGIGFESANSAQLRRYGKQQSLEENFVAADNLVKRGIALIPGLITFDPFATPETIRDNLDFLFRRLHHYHPGKLSKRLHLIAGTPIVNLVQKHDLLIGDSLNMDYKFLHAETARLYETFCDYQRSIANADLGLMDIASETFHMKNIDSILGGRDWRQNWLDQRI